MILSNFKDFPRVGRILGVDWGARRTGFAVCDGTREFIFTRPAFVARSHVTDIARQIAKTAQEEEVVGIVMGLPMHLDGTPSETTEMVRRCAARLATYIDLPIAFIEENLTSLAAQESMGKVRRVDIKQYLDSEAARVILENAIAMIRRA